MNNNKCIVCKIAFIEGDLLQAFLRSPDDPDGSWTKPVLVDKDYQNRAAKNTDKIKRKHSICVDGKYSMTQDEINSMSRDCITVASTNNYHPQVVLRAYLKLMVDSEEERLEIYRICSVYMKSLSDEHPYIIDTNHHISQENKIIVYALQVSGKQDKLFISLERAIEEANEIVGHELDGVTLYPPDKKYYFYAVQESTTTRVTVTSTIVVE